MSACSLKCTSPDSHSPSQLYATRLDQPAATVPSLQASCQMPACQPNPSILPSQPALLHPCFFWQPHAINSPPATVLRTSTEHLQWQGAMVLHACHKSREISRHGRLVNCRQLGREQPGWAAEVVSQKQRTEATPSAVGYPGPPVHGSRSAHSAPRPGGWGGRAHSVAWTKGANSSKPQK